MTVLTHDWIEPWQVNFDSPYSVRFTRRFKVDDLRTGTRELTLFRTHGSPGEYKETYPFEKVEWDDDIAEREDRMSKFRADRLAEREAELRPWWLGTLARRRR